MFSREMIRNFWLIGWFDRNASDAVRESRALLLHMLGKEAMIRQENHDLIELISEVGCVAEWFNAVFSIYPVPVKGYEQ